MILGRWIAVLLAVGLAVTPLHAQGTSPRTNRHAMPAVSADGSRVFFIGQVPGVNNLYVVRADGSDERRLTHDGAHQPHWIGQPGEITFSGPPASPDSGRIFAMQPDGARRRLAADILGRSPVLSPDGTRVAYLVGPWPGAELWVANADSTGARRVAGGLEAKAAAWNPAWSPDGTRLAYTFSDSTRRPQIHVVKVVGSVRDTAVTDTLGRRMGWQVPAWSPDGSKIAVQWSTEMGNGSRIAVIDLPTRSYRVIDIAPPASPDAVRDEAPAWFPDGTRIVFQSNRSGNVDLWVVGEDGTGLRQLTGVRRR